MELPLFLLVLVSLFCIGHNWTPPEFCHNKKCPVYKVINKKQDYEERLYEPTEWITTKIKEPTGPALTDAHMILKQFVKVRSLEDDIDSWPVLINITNDDFWLSWFVPSGTPMDFISKSSPVTLLQRPKTTVFVRVFGGIPTLANGKENACKLSENIHTKCIVYTGAAYESYFAFEHHNEVWISKP